MKALLGKKIQMSQRFRDDGTVVPVTIVEAGPCVITQIKTVDHDGYAAIQIGWGVNKRLAKPQRGHLKDLPTLRHLREFRIDAPDMFQRGQELTVEQFTPGDRVAVSGVSKGHGFQGVVKRHHFHGSPATHGHKDQLRMPGAIGAGEPQHVFKGTRMAGRMGGAQATVQNLEVIEVDPKQHRLVVSGALPGARNTFLMITGI